MTLIRGWCPLQIKNNTDLRNFTTGPMEEHEDDGYVSVGQFADF